VKFKDPGQGAQCSQEKLALKVGKLPEVADKNIHSAILQDSTECTILSGYKRILFSGVF
jgi:hypothetical protein